MEKQAAIKHQHQTLLKISDLTFGYTRTKSELSHLTFNIHDKEWTTIIGPNGSGKSTVAKLMARIYKPRSGSILLNQRPIAMMATKAYARLVAYVPQASEIPEGITANDFVGFGRTPWHGFAWRMNKHDQAIIDDALKAVDAWRFRDKLLTELSGGERQKIYIAMALAQDTEIIILDEPTTYLDIKAQYEILELMHRLHLKGKTIISVLHDINQAIQYSDEIIVIKNGQLYAQGAPENVINEEMLMNVYGVRAELVTTGTRKFLMNIRLHQQISGTEGHTKNKA